MHVRTPLTRSQRGFRMKYPSLKLGRMVKCESLLEGDLVRLLEFSPGVLSYQEQPARIEYWDGDCLREYFPDFELRLVNGSQIHVEVKLSTQLAKPKIAAKYRAIAEHYENSGKLFRIVTEQELRREPLNGNVRKLSNFRRGTGSDLPTTDSLCRLLGHDPQPLATVEALMGQSETWLLLASGRLVCDLTCEITPDAFVSIAQGGDDATMLF